MTDVKQALKKQVNNKAVAQQPKQNMENMLTLMANEIQKALPDNIKSERFQRIALTAFNGNPKLQQCDPVSFIAAMMQSAQLGLEPNTPLGQAYLIPFKNQVQFQIGYKGLLDLAQRTGQYKNITAHRVFEEDNFELEYGLNPKLVHIPYLQGDRGKIIGYYAAYNLINGGQGFAFMTKSEVEAHGRQFSQSFNNGPWKTDFDAMAKKTVLKQALKYAPKSIELQEATAIDERVVDVEQVNSREEEDKFVDIGWNYADDFEEIE